jgi:hypothetical protein
LRHSLLRHARIRLEHRAAAVAELRRVLPEASDDAVSVGNLIAAQAEHVTRAGQLLLQRAAVLLRLRGRL